MATPTNIQSIKVEGAKEVVKFLDQLPESTYDDARSVFLKRVAKAHAQVQVNLRTVMRVRSGTLARATRFEITGKTLKTLEGSLYVSQAGSGSTELIYARTQEYGSPQGGIKAKKAYKRLPGGPYLNIPTKNNKTAAGVTRLSAKQVFQRGGYIKYFIGGTWGVILPGTGVMFTLHKKVEVPARMGMRASMEEQIPQVLEDLKNLIGEE